MFEFRELHIVNPAGCEDDPRS